MVKDAELREFILSQGASICGFADIRILPEQDRCNMPIGIAIGMNVNPEIVSDIPVGPDTRYFDEYDNLNARLDAVCVSVSEYLKSDGYYAIAQTVSYSIEQRRTHPKHYTPVPHKTVAALAGLGWISKSSMLITKEYGSAVRLTSVLTDAPLETQTYKYECLCGECCICVDACPGNAIMNNKWFAGIDREALVSIGACRATVIERGKKFGRDNAACGICMAICPFTQKYVNG